MNVRNKSIYWDNKQGEYTWEEIIREVPQKGMSEEAKQSFIVIKEVLC